MLRRPSLFVAAAATAAIGTAHAKPAPRPPAWTHLHFGMERNAGRPGPRTRIDIYNDGRVIFTGADDGEPDAPTVTLAPHELLAQITAWARTGPALGPAMLSGEWFLRVGVDVDGKTKTATYPADKIPADEKALWTASDKLINQKRKPLACAAWDGKGAFTLTLESQDFGAVPGPVTRVTIASDGTATRAAAGGAADATLEVKKTAKATKDEIAAIRAALGKVDLDHFTDVYGGGGEGSNFRLVHLKTESGACGRAFTNTYPDALKPLVDAIAPITGRLS
jgi:hypothetical protein